MSSGLQARDLAPLPLEDGHGLKDACEEFHLLHDLFNSWKMELQKSESIRPSELESKLTATINRLEGLVSYAKHASHSMLGTHLVTSSTMITRLERAKSTGHLEPQPQVLDLLKDMRMHSESVVSSVAHMAETLRELVDTLENAQRKPKRNWFQRLCQWIWDFFTNPFKALTAIFRRVLGWQSSSSLNEEFESVLAYLRNTIPSQAANAAVRLHNSAECHNRFQEQVEAQAERLVKIAEGQSQIAKEDWQLFNASMKLAVIRKPTSMTISFK